MTRKTTPRGRKLARQTPYQRQRHQDVNPVTYAVVKSQVQADIFHLRTQSGLHAFTGANAAKICDTAGRLVYITAYAAGKAGLSETPEARILAGTANALGDIAQSPAQLEAQRGALIAGLEAIERLMPRLDLFAMAIAGMELDKMLASAQGLGTADVRRALGVA